MEWILFGVKLLLMLAGWAFMLWAIGLHGRYEQATRRISELQDAIRKHRDEKGDDRCWLDDEELYRILPEGYNPPERDSAVELQNCIAFIACRRNPRTTYVSPQREIERLKMIVRDLVDRCNDREAKLRELQRLIEDGKNGDYWIWQGDGSDHHESLTCPVLMTAAELRRLLSEKARSQSSG